MCHTSTTMAPIGDAIAGYHVQEPKKKPTYRQVAKTFGVSVTSLRHRQQGSQHPAKRRWYQVSCGSSCTWSNIRPSSYISTTTADGILRRWEFGVALATVTGSPERYVTASKSSLYSSNRTCSWIGLHAAGFSMLTGIVRLSRGPFSMSPSCLELLVPTVETFA